MFVNIFHKYISILNVYTYIYILPELEKTIKVCSKMKNKVRLSRYKRSFRINHSQMSSMIFMPYYFFLENLKWVAINTKVVSKMSSL